MSLCVLVLHIFCAVSYNHRSIGVSHRRDQEPWQGNLLWNFPPFGISSTVPVQGVVQSQTYPSSIEKALRSFEAFGTSGCFFVAFRHFNRVLQASEDTYIYEKPVLNIR